MWQISRSTFHNQVRTTLTQNWSTTNAINAPQNLLPQTYTFLSNSLPSPRNTGLLFALLHALATALPAQFIQGPNDEERITYAEETGVFLREYLVATGLCMTMPAAVYTELNDSVIGILQTYYSHEDPEAATLEAKRVALLRSDPSNLSVEQRLGLLQEHMWEVTCIYFRVLIETHLPLFRERWRDEQFGSFIAGLENGLDCGVGVAVRTLPNPSLEPIDWEQYYLDIDGDEDGELEVDDDEYLPVGPRVPLDAFCQPILLINIPQGETCTICGTKVTIVDIGDEAVVTVCGHYFHAECLGSWVNDSAVSSSNTCPDCRKLMCEVRARVPVDVYDENGDGNGEDYEDNELLRYTRQLRGDPAPTKPERSNQLILESFSEAEDFL